MENENIEPKAPDVFYNKQLDEVKEAKRKYNIGLKFIPAYFVMMILLIFSFALNLNNIQSQLDEYSSDYYAECKKNDKLQAKYDDLKTKYNSQKVALSNADDVYDDLWDDYDDLLSQYNTLKAKYKKVAKPKKSTTKKSSSKSSSSSSSGSSNSSSDDSSTSADYIVHITDYGSKYHAAGCRYLKKSDITISKSEAEQRGLSPCSVCNP